ncbi:MAG: DUF115 domain-containing protein, partial [Treponema sp.]|nr:DUF115 domain-containing protein [Treponema sp.]
MQGQPFVRNGKTLLSGKDPVGRCGQIADAVNVQDRTLYFCPSPIYGYGIDKLMARLETMAPNSAVLCVEADKELFELAQSHIDVSGKRLHLTGDCDSGNLCALVRNVWGARAFRRIETIRFTGGWQLYPDIYNSLHDALQREIATDWSNTLTLAKLGRLYIRNFFKNLSLLNRFPSVGELSFGDAPVLVLGAGPSLDETLDALAAHFKGNLAPETRPFKIVCADTCLGALADRELVPDLTVILESQHWNLRDFIGHGGWDIPAAVDLSALPQSALFFSKGYVFLTPWTQLRIFERLKAASLLPEVIPPLGSVGLTAVEITRRITRGAIICAGLDFSFAVDKYHARSTPGARTRLNTRGRFTSSVFPNTYETSFSAVSKSGSPVRSSPIMRNYRDLFEQEFSELKFSELKFGGEQRIFDITGTGLPLGIKTLSMEDAMGVLVKSCSNFSTQSTQGTQRHGEELFDFI